MRVGVSVCMCGCVFHRKSKTHTFKTIRREVKILHKGESKFTFFAHLKISKTLRVKRVFIPTRTYYRLAYFEIFLEGCQF
jgi:hypothetical protein